MHSGCARTSEASIFYKEKTGSVFLPLSDNLEANGNYFLNMPKLVQTWCRYYKMWAVKQSSHLFWPTLVKSQYAQIQKHQGNTVDHIYFHFVLWTGNGVNLWHFGQNSLQPVGQHDANCSCRFKLRRVSVPLTIYTSVAFVFHRVLEAQMCSLHNNQ